MSETASEALTGSQIYWDVVSTEWSIALCIVSALVAMVSVIFVALTIRQNNKMMESKTRPYIGISAEYVHNGTAQYKLVLKNYGQSEGTIKALDFSIDLKGSLGSRKELTPFGHIIGATILPGQSFVCELSGEEVRKRLVDFIEASIEYTSSVGKKYNGSFNVPFGAFIDIPPVRSGSATDNAEQSLHNLSFTLQTIADKML